MAHYDVVIVGGSAAGITCGITARRHYKDKSILLIRGEEQVLIPCGIPYIFGTVGAPEKNLIGDGVLEKHNIELSIDEVSDIDRENKVLKLVRGDDVSYDKLVLATGSQPVQLPLPGSDMDGTFSIKKSVPYLKRMLATMADISHLVIIGGGFIGVEFADECKKCWDLDVTVIEMLPYPLQTAFDDEFCSEAHTLLESRGINVITGAKVEALQGGNAHVEAVKLDDGRELKADAVIQSVGMKANSTLAEKCGLDTGPTGAVQVDRAMRTVDRDIFACGDCAEKVSFFTGEPSPLRLASIASTEARVVGANLFGITRAYPGAIGVYSTIIGDTAFATAGLTEDTAAEAGYCAVAGRSASVNRHPGMMPGGAEMSLKLIFERQTRTIVGGQIMGAKSGGELINTVSACIQQSMTADQIATFQTGTHPALTASPVAYQLVNAAEDAIGKMGPC